MFKWYSLIIGSQDWKMYLLPLNFMSNYAGLHMKIKKRIFFHQISQAITYKTNLDVSYLTATTFVSSSIGQTITYTSIVNIHDFTWSSKCSCFFFLIVFGDCCGTFGLKV